MYGIPKDAKKLGISLLLKVSSSVVWKISPVLIQTLAGTLCKFVEEKTIDCYRWRRLWPRGVLTCKLVEAGRVSGERLHLLSLHPFLGIHLSPLSETRFGAKQILYSRTFTTLKTDAHSEFKLKTGGKMVYKVYVRPFLFELIPGCRSLRCLLVSGWTLGLELPPQTLRRLAVLFPLRGKMISLSW